MAAVKRRHFGLSLVLFGSVRRLVVLIVSFSPICVWDRMSLETFGLYTCKLLVFPINDANLFHTKIY